MPCYSPLRAWQTVGGEVIFAERGSIRRELSLPCGQCVGCRLERSRKWAVRCIHEAQLHKYSSFVTLTYDDEHLPPTLVYSDFQSFMRRLRRKVGPCRFFMCGEYGERLGRPHYHACLFGAFFGDRRIIRESGGIRLYSSELLSSCWPHGFASVGDVTFESAAYCARYVMKKMTGPGADAYYQRVDLRTGELVQVVPEFCHMSLKPGIGARWIEKYQTEVYGYDRDAVLVNGIPCKPPRFYDKFLQKFNADVWEHVEYDRYVRSGKCTDDSTPERLAVREQVCKARLSFKTRSLD